MVTFDNENQTWTITMGGDVFNWEHTMKALCNMIGHIDEDSINSEDLYWVSNLLQEMLPNAEDLLNDIKSNKKQK